VTGPIVGGALGSLFLALALHRNWLTRAGVLAGLGIGALLIAGTHAAGPILLVGFLASSSLLTRARSDGPRNGWQVLANSAVPAIAALLAATGALPCAGAAVAGAIAAVTADTWATEMSGAISVPGTAAGCSGAAAIALFATWLPPTAWGPALPPEFTPVLVGGLVGMFTDSFLGATLEGRLPGINNETVNFLGSLAGAVTGCLLA
jgi:uncharacterized membrane protein